ncbi:MAG: glycosyltransferase family A protein [bacterium]|nr:glycosyltransferase family A protein [bacterium]
MISIIICTRGRPAGLQRTLNSLAMMAVPNGVPWEIIVVENDTRDAAREAVTRFREASRLDVHYLHEARPGLSRAKNRGMRSARGEVFAFTDDDIVVDPDWLAQIHQEFGADPALGMLTGRVLMRFPDGSERLVRGGANRETFRFPSNPRRVGSGGNLALRASVAARVGLFDERLGPGVRAWGGEDIDYVYRAMRSGCAVLYSPKFLVYHERDPARGQRLPHGMGAVLAKHALRGDRWMARLLLVITRRLLSALLSRGTQHRTMALRRLLALYSGVLQWIGLEIQGWIGSLWGGNAG